ncbi:MAG: Ig-like domain-containing protein, partial [Planctomycetia bacterium]
FIPSLQMLESRETPSVTAIADQFGGISPYVPTILNVLQNDVNPDGSGFTLIGNTSVTPAGPSLSQNPDGTFTFNSPNAGNFSFDYTISGKLHQLTSPDNSTTDDFGRSIAMSADGNTMIIGAPNDNIGSNIDQGSAYIFTKTPSGWIQQAQLVAPNPSAFDKFGSSVDITADGNTVVIKASSTVHS